MIIVYPVYPLSEFKKIAKIIVFQNSKSKAQCDVNERGDPCQILALSRVKSIENLKDRFECDSLIRERTPPMKELRTL